MHGLHLRLTDSITAVTTAATWLFFFGFTGEVSTLHHLINVLNKPGTSLHNGLENSRVYWDESVPRRETRLKSTLTVPI